MKTPELSSTHCSNSSQLTGDVKYGHSVHSMCFDFFCLSINLQSTAIGYFRVLKSNNPANNLILVKLVAGLIIPLLCFRYFENSADYRKQQRDCHIFSIAGLFSGIMHKIVLIALKLQVMYKLSRTFCTRNFIKIDKQLFE